MAKRGNDGTFYQVSNTDIYNEILNLKKLNSGMAERLIAAEEKISTLQKLTYASLGTFSSACVALLLFMIRGG